MNCWALALRAGGRYTGQGRLQRLTAGTATWVTALQDLRFSTSSTGTPGYDAVGNLLRLEDWKAGSPQVQTFAYDERHRLTGAGAGGGDGQGTYSEVDAYDPVTGRLSRKAGLDYTYEAGHPHAVRRVTGRGGSARPVTIRARGSQAFGAWPIMKLSVNGQERATWTVSSIDYDNYTTTTPLSGHDQFEVVFTNDAWQDANNDRNLFIDFVLVDGRPVQAEGGATLIDRAINGGTAFDGQDLLPGGEGLYWTAALRFVGGADAFAGGYDATGNLTSRLVDGAAQLLRDDAEQRLVEVQDGTGARLASFAYDADGRRVQATVTGVTTAYPNAHFEYELGSGSTRKYYSAGGQRVAMRENGTLFWLLSDHLGSTTLTAAADGSKRGELRYRAWGETRSAWGSTPTSYRYTGQRQEAALGLYYYGARWYDPAIGRFIQPDTIVPEPGNPLAYDRYAYALNNPLRYTDPTGHCAQLGMSLTSIVGSGLLAPCFGAGLGYAMGRYGGPPKYNLRYALYTVGFGNDAEVKFRDQMISAANAHRIPPLLVAASILRQSDPAWPDRLVGDSPENIFFLLGRTGQSVGIGQIRPEEAQRFGGAGQYADLFDPEQSIDYMATKLGEANSLIPSDYDATGRFMLLAIAQNNGAGAVQSFFNDYGRDWSSFLSANRAYRDHLWAMLHITDWLLWNGWELPEGVDLEEYRRRLNP